MPALPPRPARTLPTSRLAAVCALLWGCGPPDLPAHYAADRTLVARRGPTVDTLDVPGGADTLDVALDLAVLQGQARWALLDPSGAEVWGGVAADDTASQHRTLGPAAGPWRFVLRPDSAVGTVSMRGSAR